MAVLNPADIRNICLCGAGSAGKTTLVERLLFQTGAIKRMGSVEEGSTVSDYSDEEKKNKHSLQPALVHFSYEKHLVNLIDTPGLGDFLGHTIACFPAVETIAVMVDALKGVQSTTRRLMAVAEQRGLPRLIIINKIDESRDATELLLEQVREAFGPSACPSTCRGRTTPTA